MPEATGGVWRVLMGASLLDRAVRPTRGRLTLGFANVEAYAVDGIGRDLPARFLDRDLNRLWRDGRIDADTWSREAARAREMRPVLQTVDALLDIHPTASVARPFFVIADLPRSRRLADAMVWPSAQWLIPGGSFDATILAPRPEPRPGAPAFLWSVAAV